MNNMRSTKVQSAALLVAMMAVVAGCDRVDQTVDSARTQASAGQSAAQQQPLGHVMEFEDFTLRANVSRADDLPEAMAQKYGIERESGLALLNLVILQNRPDEQSAPVSAKVSVRYENLSGHGDGIAMRAVEADGHVSYMGTLDASDQRFFRLIIEAQPAGTDQTLRMDFEVQLEAFDIADSE